MTMNINYKSLSILVFAALPFSAVADNTETQPLEHNNTGEHFILNIPALEDPEQVANLINEDTTDIDDETAAYTSDELARDIVDYAATHLGTPYRWGSTGPKSFDCSGFVGHVFKNFDIKLNRTSRDQFRQGERVNVKDIKPGDLMFFAGRSGGSTVGHVGMAVEVRDDGSVKFIHSATRQGVIYNVYPKDKYYGKRFLGARRVIPSES